MKKSRILHADSWLGLLTARALVKGQVLGFYYGWLVYTGLTMERHRMKNYEERVMEVTVKTYLKSANELPEKATDKYEVDLFNSLFVTGFSR